MKQEEHGPTTWRCECGTVKVMPAFVLPSNWAVLEIELGNNTILSKKSKKVLCNSCSTAFLLGGKRALLPASTARIAFKRKQLSATASRPTVSSRAKSAQSRFARNR